MNLESALRTAQRKKRPARAPVGPRRDTVIQFGRNPKLLGMGEFWRVHAADMRRKGERTWTPVAVKLPKRHKEKRVAQLMGAELAARRAYQHHPHVLNIHHWHRGQPGSYMVIERARGSMRDEIKAGAYRERRILIQDISHVLEALYGVHIQGNVYGDLRPANALVFGRPYKKGDERALRDHLDQRVVKLADFQFHVKIEEGERQRIRGVRKGASGSSCYVVRHPESTRFGPHWDLYGVGVILYEIISGRRLHQKARVSQKDLNRLRDDPLHGVMSRALLAPVDESYHNAEEMKDNIQRTLMRDLRKGPIRRHYF